VIRGVRSGDQWWLVVVGDGQSGGYNGSQWWPDWRSKDE